MIRPAREECSMRTITRTACGRWRVVAGLRLVRCGGGKLLLRVLRDGPCSTRCRQLAARRYHSQPRWVRVVQRRKAAYIGIPLCLVGEAIPLRAAGLDGPIGQGWR